MTYSRFMAALGCALIASAAAHSKPPSVSAALQEQLKQAIMGNCPAVRKEDCVKPDQLDVRLDKLFGDYARIIVSRADGQGETEGAYLKKENSRWIVLDEGTGMNPVELGIPREVW